MDVIHTTMTDTDPDPIVSGDNVITGTASIGASLLVETMAVEGLKPVETAVAADNRYRIQLPHPASGFDVFYLTITGQYGEVDKKQIVANIREKGENLFYNPEMTNGAEGWQLIGPRQTITSDDEGTVFTLNEYTYVGACQFKTHLFLIIIK